MAAAPSRRDADIVVFSIRRRDGKCDGCGRELDPGKWVRIEGGPQGEKVGKCMSCAGLADLVQLPTGDPAFTRRAKALSSRWAVVVRWSRTRKRYEREGWLLEPKAVEEAAASLRAEGKTPRWVDAGDTWIDAWRARPRR